MITRRGKMLIFSLSSNIYVFLLYYWIILLLLEPLNIIE